MIHYPMGKRIARNLKRASAAAVFRLRTLVMGYGAFPLSTSSRGSARITSAPSGISPDREPPFNSLWRMRMMAGRREWITLV